MSPRCPPLTPSAPSSSRIRVDNPEILSIQIEEALVMTDWVIANRWPDSRIQMHAFAVGMELLLFECRKRNSYMLYYSRNALPLIATIRLSLKSTQTLLDGPNSIRFHRSIHSLLQTYTRDAPINNASCWKRIKHRWPHHSTTHSIVLEMSSCLVYMNLKQAVASCLQYCPNTRWAWTRKYGASPGSVVVVVYLIPIEHAAQQMMGRIGVQSLSSSEP